MTDTATALPIQVLLVERDPAFRSRVAHAVLAAADLALSAACGSAAEGLAHLNGPPPQVAVIDLNLPDRAGLAMVQALVSEHPTVEVLVSAAPETSLDDVMQALAAGAHGCLLKQGDRWSLPLVDQIHMLCAGASPVAPPLARLLIEQLHAQGLHHTASVPAEASHRHAPCPLSAQELTVLELSAQGCSFEVIAERLQVSRHTVLTYARRAYRKLAVRTKAEAVSVAHQRGYIGNRPGHTTA